MIWRVDIRTVEKDLRKVPVVLLHKFRRWVWEIEHYGLEEVRKITSWRDHSLYGDRKGQRAIALNRKWRVVYVLTGEEIKIVKVIEVHPHAY